MSHTHCHLFYTLLSSIYFPFECLKLAPIMEWNPYQPILLIVRIVQFPDTNNILMNLVHFLAKMNLVFYPNQTKSNQILFKVCSVYLKEKKISKTLFTRPYSMTNNNKLYTYTPAIWANTLFVFSVLSTKLNVSNHFPM